MLRLKELREQRKLTQKGLAMKLNVSQSTISAYEIGERVPDLEILVAIADFFRVSLDYLAGLTDVREQANQPDLRTDKLGYLDLYRQLSDLDKEKLKSYMDELLSKT